MPKKFGEPDKEKNTLSLDESALDAVTGGHDNSFNMNDLISQAQKNIDKKKGEKGDFLKNNNKK